MEETKLPIQTCVDGLSKVRQELGRVIVGQEEAIELALIGLICEGHLLFEGAPGLGKTLLARSLATCLRLHFSRVQFTPDLMPSDILGTSILPQFLGSQGVSSPAGMGLSFEPGPIFSNIVLADEINRASPKTQSALLEAMQERAVTVRGLSRPLPRPFLVLATQNPLEMEGTYPLPEAQVDRFLFKIMVNQPSKLELQGIVERCSGAYLGECQAIMREEDIRALQAAAREIVAPPPVLEFAVNLTLATQPERPDAPEALRRCLRYGAGPRGALALIMAAKARALSQGRLNASIADVEFCLLPALRHRLALNFTGQSEGVHADQLLGLALGQVRRQLNLAKD